MDLAAVMTEVADRLRDNIAGWSAVHPHPVKLVVPPAAVVSYPEAFDFDATYGRGADRMVLPVAVVLGKVSDRTTFTQVAMYCAGAGTGSVKETLERSGPYASCDDVRVASVEFDAVTIGGVDYLAALFTLEIFGTGSA